MARKTTVVAREDVLSTGDVCRKIGVNPSVPFVLSSGVKPVLVTPTGHYWMTQDFPAICYGLAARLAALAADGA